MRSLAAKWVIYAWLVVASLGSRSLAPEGAPAADWLPPLPNPQPGSGSTHGGTARAAQPSVPPLFDTTIMPSRNDTCRNCENPNDLNFCCGVCVFRGMVCREEFPRKDVSSQVLKQLQRSGLTLEKLKARELWRRIRGRTLWFVGDSQTWGTYQAAECFLAPFVMDYRRRNITDDPTLRERLTNRPADPAAPPWYPMCLPLAENTRICVVRINRAIQIVNDVLPTLRLVGNMTKDIMVWNFGLHIAPDARVYGEQLELAASYREANLGWLPKMVWADTAPTHFAGSSNNGARSAGGQAARCGPLPDTEILRQGGPYNIIARDYLPRLGDAHLQTWNDTVPLWYAHNGGSDCIHFCSPGVYQLWVYLLNQVLRDAGLGNRVKSSS